MKGIASLFSEEARQELEKQLDIILSDEHDYSADELEDIFGEITENFPYEFGPDGEPLRMGRIFEDILNVFYKNHLPT